MEKLRLDFEPFLDERTQRFLVNGVDNYNIAATGEAAYYPVNFVLRSSQGEVAGGLVGQIWGKWLQVTNLWIAEPFRQQGYAAQLLDSAEVYARERDCVAATLETHNSQARRLYEKRGYVVFGTLADYPKGHAKYFLVKRFG